MLESRHFLIDSAENNLGDLSRLDDVITSGGPVVGPDGESQGSEGGIREQRPEESQRFLAFLQRRSGASLQANLRRNIKKR